MGRTGIGVGPYCPGTMMFGAVGDPDDSVRIIHEALDAGIFSRARLRRDRADALDTSTRVGMAARARSSRRDAPVTMTIH